MGVGLSRPQYSYIDRVRPTEYFRTCDPSDCFCGTTHSRERHVAVQRLPGGQEVYRDPAEIMNRIITGAGYGGPMMGMGMGMGTAPGYAMPSTYAGQPMMSAMPMMAAPNVMATSMTPAAPSGTSVTVGPSNTPWPVEWKELSEWTVRDFNRLNEIMEEYLNRQRGRGFPASQMKHLGSPRLSREDPWNSSSYSSYGDMPFERSRPRHPEFEDLQMQLMKYVEESKQQMQAMNDFLYGSERERREEVYKERQRKMIEEIVKKLFATGRGSDQSFSGMRPEGGHTMPGYPGSFSGPHMNPFMPQGSQFPGMSGGHPTNTMGGGMSPFPPHMGMGPSMADYNEWPAGGLGMSGRQRNRRKGIGFLDDFNDDFSRRRLGKNRFGLDDDRDDLFNHGGDDEPFSRPPPGPKKPRPDQGGGGGAGAWFDEYPATSRGQETPSAARTVRFASPEVQHSRPAEVNTAYESTNQPSLKPWTVSSPPPVAPSLATRTRPYAYTGSWPDASRSPGGSLGASAADSSRDA